MTIYTGSKNMTIYDGSAFSLVKPIDFSLIPAHDSGDSDMEGALELLLNTGRYGVIFALDKIAWLEANGLTCTGAENATTGARPALECALALSVLWGADLWDYDSIGVTATTGRDRCVDLIVAAVNAYKNNYESTASSWGYAWQAAHIAGQLAYSASILWDYIPRTTRVEIARIIQYEANRIGAISPPYRNTVDTKAEENAWNSSVLAAANAIFKGHANCDYWRGKEVNYEISAYSTLADTTDNTVVEGVTVSTFLGGHYNVDSAKGFVINHSFYHPDYQQAAILYYRNRLLYRLLGLTPPASTLWGAERSYQAFTTILWDFSTETFTDGYQYQTAENNAPCYNPDGSYQVRYPVGTDWSPYRYDIYYAADAFAHVLGWENGIATTPQTFMRNRRAKIIQMQERHTDRHLYESTEWSEGIAESMCMWMATDAYLALRIGNGL